MRLEKRGEEEEEGEEVVDGGEVGPWQLRGTTTVPFFYLGLVSSYYY